jgi:thiamine kinase-like enzyme
MAPAVMTDPADAPTALFDDVPGWAGRPRTVERLGGGITNHNWRVTVDGASFVVRAPGDGTELLGIDREHERQAAERAAGLGIAPEVVAFVHGSLVTRYVDGAATLTPSALAGPDQMAAAAELIWRFHESPPIASVFDWYAVPHRYAETASAQGVRVPATYEAALVRARDVHAAFASAPDPAVPAHNDLLSANFLLDADERLWLIDWEYAGMNDRFFDLGNFAVNNELDDDGDEALVESYFGEVTAGRVARLRLMKVMSDFREAMWGVVQQGVSSLDVDFGAYADEHFDRLLANAARPGWSRLLADAAAGSEPAARAAPQSGGTGARAAPQSGRADG